MELAALFQSMRNRLRSHDNTHILLMVKLTTIFLLAGCLQLSAKSYGQYITLSKKNAPLQEIFLDIYRQTGYYFMCEDKLLETASKVDIQVKDATLKDVLEICFKDQPLVYTISDHVIVVSKKAFNQVFEVDGKVINEKGELLEGAVILIKGTGHGTATDSKGNFHLQSDAKIVSIEISYTGYQTKIVRVNAGEFISIQLSLSL